MPRKQIDVVNILEKIVPCFKTLKGGLPLTRHTTAGAKLYPDRKHMSAEYTHE